MTRTKGNVIIEDIKVGDIHYEYDMQIGMNIECKVLTKPTQTEEGNWTWKSQDVNSDEEIDYMVNPEYSHYAPNLYDYEAYYR